MSYTEKEQEASMGRMLAELEQKFKVAQYNFDKMRKMFEEGYNCKWEKERKKYQQENQR